MSGNQGVRGIFTDQHRWFRETARAFVDREILPRAEKIRAERRIPREVWHAAGRQELLGLGVPAEYGGSGVDDFLFNAVLQEELSSAGAAYSSAFSIHVDVVAPYLVELTTAAQRERWLPPFCRGEIVAAIAMTEPNAGSDLGALQSRAAPDGDGWILNGSKTFITNGTSADLVIVAARTGAGSARDSISLFLVEAAADGFRCGRKLEKVGQHEADTAELYFTDLRLPAESLLGQVGGGFPAMMERLPQERISSACSNVAHAAVTLETTLAYVKERRAFGRPIGTFQSSRFALAEMATEVDVTQAFVDRCLAEHVAGRLGPVDAAKAKWWSAEVQNRVTDRCVQLYGGYGYMAEYEVARAWSDARVTKIWAGSNEIMKEIIGRSLGLGDPPR
jgi:alkylation response protein AidB-like acyl-CoA dehydrogenase